MMQTMPHINLLPRELKPKPLFRWQAVLGAVMGLLAVAALALYLFLFMLDLHTMRQEAVRIEQEVVALEHLPAKEAYLRQLEVLLEQSYTQYAKGRPYETELIALVHQRLPERSSLLNVSILANGTISFRGHVDSYDTAALMAMNFSSHPQVTDVSLQSLSKVEEGQYAFHLNFIILWDGEGRGQ